MSLSEPEVVSREATPYVAIAAEVPMAEVGSAMGGAFQQLFATIGRLGIEPAGPPFARYLTIDMERSLQLEFGVAVAGPLTVDGDLITGTLPAGRYCSLVHHGWYDGLIAANGALIDWAGEQGLQLDSTITGSGAAFGCRVEFSLTDPTTVPDPADNETEVAIRLAD